MFGGAVCDLAVCCSVELLLSNRIPLQKHHFCPLLSLLDEFGFGAEADMKFITISCCNCDNSCGYCGLLFSSVAFCAF